MSSSQNFSLRASPHSTAGFIVDLGDKETNTDKMDTQIEVDEESSADLVTIYSSFFRDCKNIT